MLPALTAFEHIVQRGLRRLNGWKIALVISGWLSALTSLYLGLCTFNFSSSISGYLGAWNDNDWSLASKFANAMESDESLYIQSALLEVFATISVLVALIGWTHANAKLAAQIAPKDLTFSTGWAVGAWFVPFLNFFRPREIIKESLKVITTRLPKALLNTWWVFFVITGIFSTVLARLEDRANAAFDLLGENSSWASIEETFLDFKIILYLDTIYYWVIALIAWVLLLTLISKSKPSGHYEESASEADDSKGNLLEGI